jgi:hypothetical protein
MSWTGADWDGGETAVLKNVTNTSGGGNDWGAEGATDSNAFAWDDGKKQNGFANGHDDFGNGNADDAFGNGDNAFEDGGGGGGRVNDSKCFGCGEEGSVS